MNDINHNGYCINGNEYGAKDVVHGKIHIEYGTSDE